MSNVDFRAPEFAVLATRRIADLHLCESRDGHQVLPLNTCDANTHAERDNISAWGLREFRTHYRVPTISKEDVFHYIYALLHPGYRTAFDAILRKEIPRITLAPDFATFARTGERLLELHARYESTQPTPLKQVVTKRPLRYGIDDRLRFTPNMDGIIVNETLTLLGIEPAALKYRLGTRSAIEWVIDQYVGESTVEHDENVSLIGQVLAVSEQTVALVQGLPAAFTS